MQIAIKKTRVCVSIIFVQSNNSRLIDFSINIYISELCEIDHSRARFLDIISQLFSYFNNGIMPFHFRSDNLLELIKLMSSGLLREIEFVVGESAIK